MAQRLLKEPQRQLLHILLGTGQVSPMLLRGLLVDEEHHRLYIASPVQHKHKHPHRDGEIAVPWISAEFEVLFRMTKG